MNHMLQFMMKVCAFMSSSNEETVSVLAVFCGFFPCCSGGSTLEETGPGVGEVQNGAGG